MRPRRRHHTLQEIKERLAELGMVNTDDIRVVRDDGWGPVIIEIRNRQYMIGRGVAYKLGLTRTGGRGMGFRPR